mmetsp:Transcript_34816/g.33130  ORF Transcript_34816/g.33130 Transcript_34816/m.33130 type:complete len:178 (-) Transcript_34816:202-735(-)
MSWRNRSKRSRNTTFCTDCDEEIDLDDDVNDPSFSCGECQKTVCETCAPNCAICDENLSKEIYDMELTCCQSCSTSCEETSCEELIFHKSCLVEHLKNCTQKSRAQRMLSTACETISTTESDLVQSESELVRIQSRIELLKGTLAEAKEAKILAEIEANGETDDNIDDGDDDHDDDV